MSDSLAVKYRPRKIADVIGQSVVVTSITNAFKSKTLHHAYIFGGNLGCGKTSTARIVAAMENCQKDKEPTLEPCGVCSNCVEIFNGKSIDVVELDAASNRSIENIRDMSKDARECPISCRTKYFIIDEAHSLTGPAAEAALKLIEEPPPGVRFIFCTTSPHLLKDTIHSRCINFRFQKVSSLELFEHVKKIAALENISYEENAIKMVSRIANGSVRNSLTALQSLLNFAGTDKILFEDAKKILGAVDEKYYFDLIDAIVKINAPSGMLAIQGLLKEGKNASDVIDGLHQHLRNILIIKTCGKDANAFDFTEEEVKKYQHASTDVKLGLVLELMSLLVDLNRGLTLNMDPQVLMEKYLIEAIIAKKKTETQAVVKTAAA